MEKIKLFNVSELEPQIGKKVFVKDEEIGIFLLESGEIKAIGNRCPHKNGPLTEGTVSEHYVFCPLHDRKIDLNDGQVQAPDEADGCVSTYKVEVDNGELFIWID
ncbi:nitrite reductase [Macrococcus epidermidis]|uniref:Nitrite reductase n=1 Tax=Macrococcus epidermidis TaxID=1902580 RepID=A0A327ZZM8_9STAP|nr:MULTISPECIES: nitrite reductase (NAD(P)H) small subunit [Macrococcus]MCG7419687.1 nitrite reductase (NAD(P)H) small subunit [Macrococcus epidermidis]MCH4984044.1 nitrite reductase (NAD(P)H) small subunit [Macrococcus sp. PK]RAK47034.1 nitrite reductase [Macrococcus epidermidis]TDM39811.1 nitrite reductase (NAD(P)H) small subunit [Macrococcus goetzii]TDM46290.1 nitrite reductase (NAD(P)H) small subunit [Macrococcus goetzii]